MPRDPHKDQPVLQGGTPLAEATAVLVLLHGRGGSAQEMLALARALQGTDLPASAPSPRSGEGDRGRGTPEGGEAVRGRGDRLAWFAPEAAGRQWYPYSLLEKVERNRPSLNSALGLLKRVVAKIEAAGVPSERVVLIGFSQGAGVVLEFAARNPRRYGGIVALSGALLGPEGTPRDYAGSLAGTPLFLGAGDTDPHLPKRRVDETAAVFESLGATVTKQIYPGLGHAMNDDEKVKLREIVERL